MIFPLEIAVFRQIQHAGRGPWRALQFATVTRRLGDAGAQSTISTTNVALVVIYRNISNIQYTTVSYVIKYMFYLLCGYVKEMLRDLRAQCALESYGKC